MDERLGLGRRLAGRTPDLRPRPTDDRQEKLNDDWISTDDRGCRRRLEFDDYWISGDSQWAADPYSMTTGFGWMVDWGLGRLPEFNDD